MMLVAVMQPITAISSLYHVASCDSIIGVDTLTLAVDTLLKSKKDTAEKAKKEPLDAPVEYESSDSMVWIMGGNANLYGNGKVTYDKIELDASIISMNISSTNKSNPAFPQRGFMPKLHHSGIAKATSTV